MKLSELIATVGDEHVEFQNLRKDYTHANLGARSSTIRFATDTEKVLDVVLEREPRFIGLVVWIPSNRMPSDIRADLGKKGEEGGE